MMADKLTFQITWQNLLIGVVFVVVANLIAALLGMFIPLPAWLWSGIAAAVGVAAWFFFMARWKR
jgi:hypothetical protein